MTNLSKKEKIEKLLKILSIESDKSDLLKPVNEELNVIFKNLKRAVETKTIEEANNRFKELKEAIDFQPLINSLGETKERLEKHHAELRGALIEGLQSLEAEIKRIDSVNELDVKLIAKEIASLRQSLGTLADNEIPSILDKISRQASHFESALRDATSKFEEKLAETKQSLKSKKEIEREINELKIALEKKIEDYSTEINNSISRVKEIIYQGGGNANRNIAIGGNTSVLSQYSDINLKAGSNVTITYAKNTATKYTDVTISASGGGGGGTVRSISSVATSQTLEATSGTDYVYIANAGIKLTMPTAAGNSNLYTIKNTGVSSVLLVPDGTDTIDNDTSLILNTRYTAVDLISDGVNNWNIT